MEPLEKLLCGKSWPPLGTSTGQAQEAFAPPSPRPALRLRGGEAARPPRVLLGLTGSVATIKAAELVRSLSEFADVRVVVTTKGEHFFDAAALTEACGVEVLTDEDEWAAWKERGDPVQHIELRRWADLFLIAPVSANTLAKLAGGLCDNLLTCVARAWELGKKPLLFAPAMNTAMWEHPATAQHVATLEGWGARSIPPVAKVLICGDTGVGAMAPVDGIAGAVRGALEHAGIAAECPPAGA